MSHQDEYGDNLVTMLEVIWGEGYMAPGGPGNVSKILEGIETKGKRVLDIGCGIGGPALEIAEVHGAEVVGIDLESSLIRRACQSAKNKGLQDKCKFYTVEAGLLDFPDNSFDIVVTSGAMTQTTEKLAIFEECFRVLFPGGYLTSYDWMRPEGKYSEDMLYWFKMEGLTYALETIEHHEMLLEKAGYINIYSENASAWYKSQVRNEYELMKTDLYDQMLDLLGKQDADHFVENWRAMLTVCENDEMIQGYYRGQRPL